MNRNARRLKSRALALVGLLALLALTLALTSCATLFSPRSQDIPVTTTPDGALVLVDGTRVGTTPLTLQLDRRSTYDVLVQLDGQERAFALEGRIDGVYVALDTGPGLALSILSLAAAAGGNTSFSGEDLTPTFVTLAVLQAGSAVANVAIDASTGAWLRLTPGSLHVTFE